MKIYISGPIAGYPEGNEREFRRRARELDDLEHTVVVPHDIVPEPHEGSCPPGYATNAHSGHSSACHLKADILALMGCDAVVLLTGYAFSVGAQFEIECARMFGMPVFYPNAEVPS